MITTKTKCEGMSAILLIFVLLLAGCTEDTNNSGDKFVAVTNITGVPATAMIGVPLTLTGTVSPSNATHKTIVWSAVSGSAVISGGNTLTPNAAGTVVVRATITNGIASGRAYTKEFSITVNESAVSFTAVSNISGVPTTAVVGTPLTLTGTVEPSNATNKTIAWSVISGSAVISGGNTLTPNAAGTVVVRASIADGTAQGTAYTREFNIIVNDDNNPFTAVSNISGVPTTAVVGTPLTLTGTVEPSNATNKTIAWSVVSGSAVISGGNTLTPNAAGTVVVRASIADGTAQGTAYTREFNIAASGGITDSGGIDIGIGDPSVKLYLDGTLLQGESTIVTKGTGAYTVSIASGAYDEIIWYLNGSVIAQGKTKTSVALSKQTEGTFHVTVEATPADGVKDSGSHSFVVKK